MLIGAISQGEATHGREGSRAAGRRTEIRTRLCEKRCVCVTRWRGGAGRQQKGRAVLIQIVENNKIPEEISELFPPRLIQHLQLRSLGQGRAVGVGSGELAAPSSVPLSSITPSAQPDI